jgi:hypothetical protein
MSLPEIIARCELNQPGPQILFCPKLSEPEPQVRGKRDSRRFLAGISAEAREIAWLRFAENRRCSLDFQYVTARVRFATCKARPEIAIAGI